MSAIIECVPNFSEGRDPAVIRQITDQVATVEGVRLLDVDPGKATHRTVVTFAGPPAAVIEAAVRCVAKATELIDMRRHKGEHPRFGATDVLPLVPIAGITMEETVEWARRLGRRLGDELGLTGYFYERAATREGRRNLAEVRSGEYEGLEAKLAHPDWAPDFGPARFNPKSGATAVGARDFLVAYNVNLNTTSTRRANAIANDVREKGRPKRVGDQVVKDAEGNTVYEPGTLSKVKAIGWYIEEYGICQISMNITDISVTPVHEAYEEVFRKAEGRGVRVTGSELVGLVPLKSMLEAGRYFLRRQQRSLGVPDRELVATAVRSMGLDQLAPFDPDKKIIEYVLAAGGPARLVDKTVTGFVEETAAESPAPGGGSVAATLGALGAALGTMVANLSSHKKGWDERWEEFSNHAEGGKRLYVELLRLVDEDTRAFNALRAAFGLPKGSPEEKAARTAAVQAAYRGAIEVPLMVMRAALASMALLKAMVETGLPASVSDAGVGALCARSAVLGAGLNVRINAGSLEDRALAERLVGEARELAERARAAEAEILALVDGRL